MLNDQIVFIVDLNEVEHGNILPVSMDYTLNAGAGVLDRRLVQPKVGSSVMVHSDDDNTLYYAKVTSIKSERDLKVKIYWDSCKPVINTDWSAQHLDAWSSRESHTLGSVPVSESRYE